MGRGWMDETGFRGGVSRWGRGKDGTDWDRR